MAPNKKAYIHLSEIIPEELSGISFEFRIIGKGQLDADGNPVSYRTVIDNRGKLRLDQNDGTEVPLDQIPDILEGKNAEVIVRNDGVEIGQGRILDFIPGSGTSLAITSSGSVISIEITAGGAGAVHNPIVIPFIMTGLNNGWYGIPTGVTEFFETINSRTKFDLTNRTQARLVVPINGGNVDLKIRVQYSTNQVDWDYLDGDAGPSCDTCWLGLNVSGWVTLTEGAKADVYLRLVAYNSSEGVLNCDFGNIVLQVK